MKIFINDANILIDLIKLGLVEMFFDLPETEFQTTDFVFEEISPDQRKILEPFVRLRKLVILVSEPEDLTEISSIFNKTTGLSFQDCSVWHYTAKHGGILLTGDGKLRKLTIREKIEVRGMLYLFDEFLRCKLLDFQTAIEKLSQLKNTNNRLPAEEIDRRIDSWKNNKHI